MIFDYPVSNRKTQAGALVFGFCGEEWVEKVGHDVLRYSGARIHHAAFPPLLILLACL